MKTKTQNQKSELKNRPEQLSTGNRGQINLQQRQANRSLNTESLLALLRREAPKFFELAEVVGKWVWIQFEQRQPVSITAALAQLGFHWSRTRQAWQHPCGIFCEGVSSKDPREKYASYFPADVQSA
jgi:hypothetical protein